MENEVFQSTLPARGATFAQNFENNQVLISIHAPREGSDVRFCARYARVGDFNPRSPRGERLIGRNCLSR